MPSPVPPRREYLTLIALVLEGPKHHFCSLSNSTAPYSPLARCHLRPSGMHVGERVLPHHDVGGPSGLAVPRRELVRQAEDEAGKYRLWCPVFDGTIAHR